MSLEIPSACARVRFCVPAWPRCMPARGPPIGGGHLLLLLRGVMGSVPIWAGLGRVGMAGSQRPPGLVPRTLCLAVACLLCSACALPLRGQNGVELSGRTLGQPSIWPTWRRQLSVRRACGEGRAGLPAQESLWAPCWPRGSGSGGLGRVTEGAGPSLLPSEFFLGLPG